MNPRALHIGLISDGKQITHPELFAAAERFRTEAYIEAGWIDPATLSHDQTDHDEDDERSLHLVVTAEAEDANGEPHVVGHMRMVHKQHISPAPLPVEVLCPDAFTPSIPLDSVEFSRLVAGWPGANAASIRKTAKWAMFAAGLGYIKMHKIPRTFALVTASFLDALNHSGVTALPLAEPRYISTIHANKVPARIDAQQSWTTLANAGRPTMNLSLGEFKQVHP